MDPIQETAYGQKYKQLVFDLVNNVLQGSGKDVLDAMTQYSDKGFNELTKTTKGSALKDAAYKNASTLGLTKDQIDEDPQMAVAKVVAYKIGEYGQKVYDTQYLSAKASGLDNPQSHAYALGVANQTVLNLYDPLTEYGTGMDKEGVAKQQRFNDAFNKFAVIDPQTGKVFVDAKDFNEAANIIKFKDEAGKEIIIRPLQMEKFTSELDKGLDYAGDSIGGKALSAVGASLMSRAGTIMAGTSWMPETMTHYGAVDEYWTKQSGAWSAFKTLTDMGVVIAESAGYAKAIGGLTSKLTPIQQAWTHTAVNTGIMSGREALYDYQTQFQGLSRQYTGDNARQQAHIAQYLNTRMFDIGTYLASSYLTGRFITSGGLNVQGRLADWSRQGGAMNKMLHASKETISTAFDASADYMVDAVLYNTIEAMAGDVFTESQKMSLGITDMVSEGDYLGAAKKIVHGTAMRVGARAYGKFLNNPMSKSLTSAQDLPKANPLMGSKEYYADSNFMTKTFAWISRRFGESNDIQIDAMLRAENARDASGAIKYDNLEAYYKSDNFNKDAYARYSLSVEATRNALLRYKFAPDAVTDPKKLFTLRLFEEDQPVVATADRVYGTQKIKSIEDALLTNGKFHREVIDGEHGQEALQHLATYIAGKVKAVTNPEDKKTEFDKQMLNVLTAYELKGKLSSQLSDAVMIELNKTNDSGNVETARYIGNFREEFDNKLKENQSAADRDEKSFGDFVNEIQDPKYRSGFTTPTKEGMQNIYGNANDILKGILDDYLAQTKEADYVRTIFDEILPDADAPLKDLITNWRTGTEAYMASHTNRDFNDYLELKSMSKELANGLVMRHFNSIQDTVSRHGSDFKDKAVNSLILHDMTQIALIQNIFGTKVFDSIKQINKALETTGESNPVLERIKNVKFSETFYNKAVTDKLKDGKETKDYSAYDVLNAVVANLIQDEGRYNLAVAMMDKSQVNYNVSKSLNLLGFKVDSVATRKLFAGQPGLTWGDNVEIQIDGHKLTQAEGYASLMFGGPLSDDQLIYSNMDAEQKSHAKHWLALTSAKDILMNTPDNQGLRGYSDVEVTDVGDKVVMKITTKQTITDQMFLENLGPSRDALVKKKTNDFKVNGSNEYFDVSVGYGATETTQRHYASILDDLKAENKTGVNLDATLDYVLTIAPSRDTAIKNVISVFNSLSKSEWNRLSTASKNSFAEKVINDLQSRKYVETVFDPELRTAIFTSKNVLSTIDRYQNGEVMIFNLERDDTSHITSDPSEQIKRGYVEIFPAGNVNKRSFVQIQGNTDPQKYEFIRKTLVTLLEQDRMKIANYDVSSLKEKTALINYLNGKDRAGNALPDGIDTINPMKVTGGLEDQLTSMLTGYLALKKEFITEQLKDKLVSPERDTKGVLKDETPIMKILISDELSGSFTALGAIVKSYPALLKSSDLDITRESIVEYERLVGEYIRAKQRGLDEDDIEIIREELEEHTKTMLPVGTGTGYGKTINDEIRKMRKAFSFNSKYRITVGDNTLEAHYDKIMARAFVGLLNKMHDYPVTLGEGEEINTKSMDKLVENLDRLKYGMDKVDSTINQIFADAHSLTMQLEKELRTSYEGAKITRQEQLNRVGTEEPRRDTPESVYGGGIINNATRTAFEDNLAAQILYKKLSKNLDGYALWSDTIKKHTNSKGTLMSDVYSVLAYGDRIFGDGESLQKRIALFGVTGPGEDTPTGFDQKKLPNIILLADTTLDGVEKIDGLTFATSGVMEALKLRGDYGNGTKNVLDYGGTTAKLNFQQISPENTPDIWRKLGLVRGEEYIIIQEGSFKSIDSDFFGTLKAHALWEPLRTRDADDNQQDILLLSRGKGGSTKNKVINRILSNLYNQSNPKSQYKKYANPFQATQTDYTINFLINSNATDNFNKFRTKLQGLSSKYLDDYDNLVEAFNTTMRIRSETQGLYAQYAAALGLEDLSEGARLIPGNRTVTTMSGLTLPADLQYTETEYVGQNQIGTVALKQMYSEKYYSDIKKAGSSPEKITKLAGIKDSIRYLNSHINGLAADEHATYNKHLRVIMDYLSEGESAVFLQLKLNNEPVYVTLDARTPNVHEGHVAFKMIQGVVFGSDAVHTDTFFRYGQLGDWDGDQGLFTMLTVNKGMIGKAFNHISGFENEVFTGTTAGKTAFSEDIDGTSMILKAMNIRNVRTIKQAREINGIQMHGADIKNFDWKDIDKDFGMAVGLAIDSLKNISHWTRMAQQNMSQFNSLFLKTLDDTSIMKEIKQALLGQADKLEPMLVALKDLDADKWNIVQTERGASSRIPTKERLFGSISFLEMGAGRQIGKKQYRAVVMRLNDDQSAIGILEGDGADFGYRIKGMISFNGDISSPNDRHNYLNEVNRIIDTIVINPKVGESGISNVHKQLATLFKAHSEYNYDNQVTISENIDKGNYRINNNAATFRYVQDTGTENVNNMAANLFIANYGANGSAIIRRVMMNNFVSQFINTKMSNNPNDPFVGDVYKTKKPGTDEYDSKLIDDYFVQQNKMASSLVNSILNTMSMKLLSEEMAGDMISFKEYDEFQRLNKQKIKTTPIEQTAAYAIYQKHAESFKQLLGESNILSDKILYSYPAEYLESMLRYKAFDEARISIFSPERLQERVGIKEEDLIGFFPLGSDGTPNLNLTKMHPVYVEQSLVANADRLARSVSLMKHIFGGAFSANDFAMMGYTVKLMDDSQTNLYRNLNDFYQELSDVITATYGKENFSTQSIEQRFNDLGIYPKLVDGDWVEQQDEIITRMKEVNAQIADNDKQLEKIGKQANEAIKERNKGRTDKPTVVKFFDQDNRALTNEQLYQKMNKGFTDSMKMVKDLSGTGNHIDLLTIKNPANVKALFVGMMSTLSHSDKFTIGLYSKGLTTEIISRVSKKTGPMGKVYINAEDATKFIDSRMKFRLEDDNVDFYMKTLNQPMRCR